MSAILQAVHLPATLDGVLSVRVENVGNISRVVLARVDVVQVRGNRLLDPTVRVLETGREYVRTLDLQPGERSAR